MNLMDTLQPQTVTITGARKVLNMSKRDDAEDLRLSQENQDAMDLAKFLKTKSRQEEITKKRNRAIHAMKVRKLRDAVRRDKARWDKSVKALEEFLNGQTLP